MHLVCPPKFCITLVFTRYMLCFLLGITVVPRETEDNPDAIFFGGRGRVVQTRCIMGDICISGECTGTTVCILNY